MPESTVDHLGGHARLSPGTHGLSRPCPRILCSYLGYALRPDRARVLRASKVFILE
jgi:hypothetical protein